VTGGAPPELRVVDDVPSAALEMILAAMPRLIQLSGGGTPGTLYERFADVADYPWDEVELFFGDERCVPEDDVRSTLRMVRRSLLSKVPARAYPIDGGACDAPAYARVLKERFGEFPRFDLAIYGLGPDGHTASLFPGRPEVDRTDEWVVRVPEAGWDPFVPRVTMTLPVLSATPLGIMLVSGTQKRAPLSRLMSGDDIPAARLFPGRLIVLADRAAAGDG
jgi:6-phosphogluconolactonase